MKIEILKIDKEVPTPKFTSEFAAGMDLYSAEEIKLAPGEHALVSTGIKLAIPDGYAGLIWDRSGMAAKKKITTTAGVIDSDYRGELKIAMVNLGTETHVLEKYTRIAQMLIQKVENLPIREVEELSESQRGTGGFGSSGHQ